MAAVDDRLAKRKLDALKRGIHRVAVNQPLPFAINVVGIGKAGADIVAATLRSLPETNLVFSALVIDVGDGGLDDVRAALAALPDGRADVEIVYVKAAKPEELFASIAQYGGFLELEYPWYHGPKAISSWLPPSYVAPDPEQGSARAHAKALYGRMYYDGDRAMRSALRRFGAKVASGGAQSVVCTIFGLGGGAGGGIAVDAARHLSTVVLGRAALSVGIGILPCAGDRPEHRGAALYACLNELDCFGDEAKNEGVVQACGELFRNPFTAGFIAVPQQHVWEATKDLEATHRRASREVADLLCGRGGANLMEVLRLLNWVAAPSTQHSAARTPFGAKWIHMLGYADTSGSLEVKAKTRKMLGLRASYHPEYVEVRVADVDKAGRVVENLAAAFSPDVPPQVVDGGRETSIQYILPCIDKFDLDVFYDARTAYDASTPDERILAHSMLLEHGVVLSEPSTRLEGMAGASLSGGEGWVAVPYDRLRGAETPAPRKPKLAVV